MKLLSEFINKDTSLEGIKLSGGSNILLNIEGWVEFGPVVVGDRDRILENF